MTLYAVMIFVTIPTLLSYSGGSQVPDLLPWGYGPEYIDTLFGKLGYKGRDYYLYRQIPLDLLYPALFAWTNTLLLVFLLSKAGGKAPGFIPTTIIPIVAGIFDYSENIALILLLHSFPVVPEYLVNWASMFTVLKSIFTTLFFILLFAVSILLFVKWIRGIASRSASP